jgi:superfamily I DNA/RNA helicase/RecB family exonuclease
VTVKGFSRSTPVRADVARVASGDAADEAADVSQAAVIQLPDDASAVIVGAPGTGKTWTLVELVAHRVAAYGWPPNDLVVIAPNRASASRLRDRLAVRLAVPTEGPLARTINSLAFEIVDFARRSAGLPPPRLLTGGDQDIDIAQLLDGHTVEGTGPAWPDPLDARVRALRSFRTELREIMMRATEYGVEPDELRDLAKRFDRPEWSAVADFQAEYLQILGELRPDQLDAAELCAAAARAIDAGMVPPSVSRLKLVVVDDVQNATRSTVAVLAALARRGVRIVAFGDPDVAVNAFRGGEANLVSRFGRLVGISGIATLHLTESHRQGADLLSLTGAVTGRIGTAESFGHRDPVPDAALAARRKGSRDPAGVVTAIASTPARLWTTVARHFRELHVVEGLAWSDLAVIVRSGAQVPEIARALALSDVPTRTVSGGVPLREEAAVRSILTMVDAGIGRIPLTPSVATELLVGPIGGLDKLALRRLRLALRTEELAGGGSRSSDDLLVEALQAPGRLATIDHRSARSAARLAETLAAVSRESDRGATIEELLWLVWESSGKADSWRAQALGVGILAAEANRSLDGVLALFTAAKRFVERDPKSTPTVFLDAVLDSEVPEDTLSPRSAADSVLVTTPLGALGLEFDSVVVAGLQDGAWPNLRLRGSMLSPDVLVRAATDTDSVGLDDRKAVLDDELRMFALAVSRARREVVLAAVANDDESASVFFSLVPKSAEELRVASQTPLTLRGVVGRLRRTLTSAGGDDPDSAATLAHLASIRVPGADPDEWHGVRPPSTVGPLYADDETVPVSPSKLGAFEDSPLDWFIESVSGTTSSTAMGIGTIVHWAMETATDPDVESVWSAIESRWDELVFESPWLAEQQRRAARKLASAVAEYLGDFARDGKTLVSAEDRFTLDVGRARVSGSIDRVELSPDGGVVIVDLKTGKPETKQEVIDEYPQLAAYQLAYASGVLDEVLQRTPTRGGGHHSGGAKLVYVREGLRGKSYREGVQAPLTDEQLEQFRERIHSASLGMALGIYPGTRDVDPYSMGDSALRALHRVRAVSSD